MKKSFLFSLAFLACICLPAQQIQNVSAAQQGKNIVVSYDLTASSGAFDILLYCSTDGGNNWGNPLNAVTGDVGKNLNAGNNKQITWNVLADIEKLTGSRIVFEVRAKPINLQINITDAFTPGCPPNDIFKPLADCDDTTGYILRIFNKYGKVIFNTKDPTKGWDGKYNDEFVESNSYLYYLKYHTPENGDLEKRGTIKVIR